MKMWLNLFHLSFSLSFISDGQISNICEISSLFQREDDQYEIIKHR